MPICAEGTTIYVPGKIVLAGEYAVLDGAPSLVLAINRGVGCHVLPGSGIETPTGDSRFVKPALEKLAAYHRYQFFDWNPVTEFGPQKPGFGGSAAACVASCIAAGKNPNDAFAIHHHVQGSGSGIDVAASIHGGMLRYHNRKVQPVAPISPLIVWSGMSAKTGPRVQQYLAWKDRAAFVKETTAIVDHFREDPIHAFSALYCLLSDMARAAKIRYQTDTIQQIVALAKKNGGAAKPSGAGGGDCVVALFPDEASLLSFQQENPFPSIPAQPCTIIQKQKESS